ncbi:MAG: DNA replication and repair protein RecF [Rhodothermia bacterium]|nr:DNA replication and repair protein RecF [Rhodothermia bacterium]
MIIEEISVKSFRSHADTTVRFSDKVNAVCGPNGAGKTNLLEAIHYLCLTKSFLTSSDTYALRQGDPYFEVRGTINMSTRSSADVRIAYVPGEGKSAFVNGAPLEKLSEIVGRFPIVVLAPDDHALTSGGPEERRRWIDNILSQAHPLYLADLLTYRRALKQRNAILRRMRGQGTPGTRVLDSWTDKIVEIGSRIATRRAHFMDDFAPFLDRAYGTIEAVAERPHIQYQTFAPPDKRLDLGGVTEAFRERLERTSAREREQGRTLVGPHRDELVFRLDDMEVRRYASQGQHRTFAVALKVGQYFYMTDVNDEPPVFLLDDVLDNLDPSRRQAILSLLLSDKIGQSIITASDERLFDSVVDFSSHHHSLVPVHRAAPAELAE